jgi:hypothetical protein
MGICGAGTHGFVGNSETRGDKGYNDLVRGAVTVHDGVVSISQVVGQKILTERVGYIAANGAFVGDFDGMPRLIAGIQTAEEVGQADDYLGDLLRYGLLAAIAGWLLKPTTDDEAVKQLCLLFKIGDGQIDVTCQSLPERKRVAVTQLDPLGEQADGDEWPGAAYTDRPATFMAYVDPIGTPSDEDFCWGLKIYLQLSERTEALAKKLIHSWIIDETDKDEMKAQTEQVRNEEWEMIKRWLAEYGLNDVPVKSPKVRR